MNKSLIVAAVMLLGSATQVFAADVGGACPTRAVGEATKAFRGRTHDYCEVKWQGLVARHDTGGQSHDSFINACSRDCYGDLGAQAAGSDMTLVTAGLLGAAIIGGTVAAATSTSGGPPASP